MTSFREYLTESVKSYNYRVKLAGEITPSFLKSFEKNLAQFDVIRMSEPKKTPVQHDPYDFPNLKNVEVNIFDVTLNYPASVDDIAAVAKSLGHDPNHIRVLAQEFADSLDLDNEVRTQNSDSPILSKPSQETTKQQKVAKEAHATAAVIKNAADTRFTVAGGTTPKAMTTNDLPQYNKSPVGSTKNKLPDIKSAAR